MQLWIVFIDFIQELQIQQPNYKYNDTAGNLTTNGQISKGSNSYIYAGGLRLGGFETGNSILQNTGNLGISANTGNYIIFSIGNGEKMRITRAGNVGCTGSIGCVGVSASGGMRIGTNLGIQNTNPQSMDLNSAPVIIFGKNNGPGFRNTFMGESYCVYYHVYVYNVSIAY